jgi:hypothetical protein
VKLSNGGDSYDWFMLAMTHCQQGDKEKARQWYDRAVAGMAKNTQPGMLDEGQALDRAEAAAHSLLQSLSELAAAENLAQAPDFEST